MHITPEEVLAVLKNLNVDSSVGLDGIHPRLLKNLAHLLAQPLSIVFNTSLRNGAFPREWLVSIIVPIYKTIKANPVITLCIIVQLV